MLMSMVPASALAAEAECNNHLEHDSTCGWREASEGCECRHEHDDSCGYAESGVCSHTEHDASCGYSAPVEAVECAHSCELCSAVKTDANYSKTAAVNLFTVERSCSCEVRCSAETRDENCPVCSVDEDYLNVCMGTKEETQPYNEAPIDCTCSAAEGAEHDASCPKYGTDVGVVAYPVEGGNIYFDTSTGWIVNPTWELEANYDVTAIVIPCQINGINVEAIGYAAFFSHKNLIRVELPDTIKSIGAKAFEGCSGLAEIEIPDGVVSIGSSAFCDCTSLNKVTLPESTSSTETSMSYGIFSGCPELTSAGQLGGNYNIEFGWSNCIPKWAFGGCESLVSVIIPEGIESVEASAFDGCTNLSDVTLPAGLKTIGERAFVFCEKLVKIDLPTSLEVIGASAFAECDSLAAIELPQNIKCIGSYAFSGCDSLTSINLPGSLSSTGNEMSIGVEAFGDCTSLSSVIISEEVRGFYGDTFKGCTKLETAGPAGGDYNIQYGWTAEIPGLAFDGCDSLISIEFYEGIVSIGYGAFSDCVGLTEVTLPSGLISTHGYVFAGCSALKKVVIPESLTSIYGGDFNGCSELKSAGPAGGDYNIQFGYKETIPANLFSESDCLESLLLPEGITTIEKTAFEECSNLEYVFIPDSVVSMGGVFADSAKLKTAGPIGGDYNIEFGWVTSIPDYAFSELSTLSDVVLPEELANIGNYSFINCVSLKNISFSGSLENIGENAFNNCVSLTNLVFPDGLLSIDGAAFENCSGLVNIVLPDGLKILGGRAFVYCESLESVVLPGTITDIGSRVFYGCPKLTSAGPTDDYSIQFGWTESIPEYAFSDNDSIKSIFLPSGIKEIGYHAFDNCDSLEKVTIPETVVSIGSWSFSGCSKLTTSGPINGGYSIEFGWETSIPKYAFDGCRTLSSVVLPTTITSIGNAAFYDCINLQEIKLPEGIISIGQFTFASSGLKEITIPSSVSFIGSSAFDCDNLTDIYYAGSEKDWLKITNNSSSIVPGTATIHFNSTGPDDTGGENVPPIPVISTGIKYLSSYDANTGLAYFDQVNTPYDTGYAVTEETVIDPETGIEGLVGSYVMVEDSVAGNQLEIVSIKALDSNVAKVAGYGSGQLFLSIGQNSQLLQLPCGLDNLESYNGKYVLYHCYEGESEIVALEVLSTYIGTLNTWENSNIKVDREFYYTNGLTVFENKEGELLATGDMVEVCVSDRIPSQPTALKVRHLIHETRVGTLERVGEGVAYIDGEPLSVDAERFEQDLVPMVGERIYYTLESGLIVYADTLSSLGYNVFVETLPDGLSAVYENDSFTPEEQKFTVTINYVYSGHIPDYCDKEVIYAQVDYAPLVISSAKWENDSGLEISMPNLKNVNIKIGDSTQFDCTASFYGGILGIGKYEPEETVEVLTGFLKIEGSIGEEKYQREKVVDVRMTVTNEALRKEEEEFSIWAVTLLKSFYAVKAVDVTAENMILKNYFSNATVNDIGHLITLWAAAMDSEIAAEKMSTLPECIKIDCVMDKGSRKGHRASLIFEFKKADFGTTINSFLEAFGFKNAGSDSGSIRRITVTIVDHDAESGPACMPDQLFSVGVSADVKGFADSMDSYLIKKYGKNLDDMLKRLVKDTVSDAAKEFIDKAISSMDGKEYVDTILTLNKEYKYVVNKAKELSSFCDRWSLPESQTYIFTSNLDFTLMQDSEAAKYISKFIKVDCPVNVYVYNPGGNLCGAIENNEVTVDNLETFLYVDGESKNIWVSNNDYRIEIIATDNGTMDYSVSEFFGGDNTRTVLFHDLPLTALSTYKGVVPDTPPESADSYALTTETGETVFPDEIISYGQILNNIAITTQPKLSYKEGDLLDLSSMVITASYSNGSSNTLSYNDSGVSSSIAHGTALNAGIHNGNVITISYGGKTADTEALTVNAATNEAAEDISAAKIAIGNHNWTASQSVANSSDSIKVWIENELNSLDLHGVNAADIVIVSFSPAIAGTSENPSGTNGSYSFRVRLSAGNESDSITVNTGVITAMSYTDPSHTHKWSIAWSYNETHHWHDCTGSGTCDADNSTASKAYDEHNFRRWRTIRYATSTTTGLKERSCTVCGYTQQTTIPIGTSPMTGDSANLTLWLSLMILSLGALGFTGYKFRRRKNKQS